MAAQSKSTTEKRPSERRDLWPTIFTSSLVSALLATLLSQGYATHAWHREQKLKALEGAVQKTLEAKAVVYEQTRRSELLGAFEQRQTDWDHALREASAGRTALLMKIPGTEHIIETYLRVGSQHEKAWMLLFEAELTDGSNGATQAYDAWLTAVVTYGTETAKRTMTESVVAAGLDGGKDSTAGEGATCHGPGITGEEVERLAARARHETNSLVVRAMERLNRHRGM